MGKIATQFAVSGINSVSDILAKSGTAFETVMQDVVVNGRKLGDHRAIVRSDNGECLGIVRERFKPNSHIAHLHELQPLLDSGFLAPAHVAVWDHGARMAFQFQVAELDMAIGAGDVVSPLLTLAFGLDGSFSDRTFLAKFRWFCTNQMGQVRAASGGQTVRHVGKNVERYADLVTNHVRGLSGQVADEATYMQRMLSAKLTGRELLGYFARSIGAADPAKVVEEVWGDVRSPEKLRGDARVVRTIVDDYLADDAGAPQSVWHAYNGVTRYVTHSEGRNPAARSARALLGSTVIDVAWERAIQLAA